MACIIVIHTPEGANDPQMHVVGEGARLLYVDDNAPDDRVYQYTDRDEVGVLTQLLPPELIGLPGETHFGEGVLVMYIAEGEEDARPLVFGSGIRVFIVNENIPTRFEITRRHDPDVMIGLLGTDKVGSKHDERHAGVEARVVSLLTGRPRLSLVKPE